MKLKFSHIIIQQANKFKGAKRKLITSMINNFHLTSTIKKILIIPTAKIIRSLFFDQFNTYIVGIPNQYMAIPTISTSNFWLTFAEDNHSN